MLSVIIPIGGDDEKGRRRRALLEELRCIRRQKYRDYEVILVEEVFKEPLYGELKVDRYIPLKAKRWNPAWPRNVGAREAKGEKHLHLDADLIFRSDYFGKVAGFKRKAFAAWSACYRLSEKGTQEWVRSRSLDSIMKDPSFIDGREGKPIRPHVWTAAGVAYCFNRAFFFKQLGGFNENFFGWGGMDNDTALRALKLLGEYPVLPGCTLYHLAHGGRKGGKGPWGLTRKHPMQVTEKLRKAKLGRKEGPTVIRFHE